MGTFALVSLMVYGTVNRLEADFLESKTMIFNTKTSDHGFNVSFNVNTSRINIDLTDYITEYQVMDFRVKVATALCFWCGIIQVIFAVLQLGAIAKYLSQPMLRGFNTAAAFHVFTTQMQHVFGIYIKSKRSKFFKIIFVRS